MSRCAPSLSDQALAPALARAFRNEDQGLAVALDHIAEFDERKLFRAAGYSSMFKYCVYKLRRSEPAAYKRIRADLDPPHCAIGSQPCSEPGTDLEVSDFGTGCGPGTDLEVSFRAVRHAGAR